MGSPGDCLGAPLPAERGGKFRQEIARVKERAFVGIRPKWEIWESLSRQASAVFLRKRSCRGA